MERSHQTLLNNIQAYLAENPLDTVTTKGLCLACHISTRTFYNYFYDKYDAAATVYISHMAPYLQENLEIWYETEASFTNFETAFLRNCIRKTDGNLFLEYLQELECEKLRMHIPESLRNKPTEMSKINSAILFFAHGLQGMMRGNILDRELRMDEKTFNTQFDSNWELVKGWFPCVLQESLTAEPQREPSERLQEMIRIKKIR